MRVMAVLGKDDIDGLTSAGIQLHSSVIGTGMMPSSGGKHSGVGETMAAVEA